MDEREMQPVDPASYADRAAADVAADTAAANAAAETPVDEEWEAAWETEDNYWHENFTSRPYGLGPDAYDQFRPAFRYGYESAQHGMGRQWEDAEPDLRAGWERYERRENAAERWDDVRDAVRDAWERAGRREPPRA